jgi:hypothetical protein
MCERGCGDVGGLEALLSACRLEGQDLKRRLEACAVEEQRLLGLIASVRARDQLIAGVGNPASHVAPPDAPGDTEHSPPTVAGPAAADGSVDGPAVSGEGEQAPGGGGAGAVVEVPLIDLEEGAFAPVDIDLSPGLISIEVYDESLGTLDTPPLFEDISPGPLSPVDVDPPVPLPDRQRGPSPAPRRRRSRSRSRSWRPPPSSRRHDRWNRRRGRSWDRRSPRWD